MTECLLDVQIKLEAALSDSSGPSARDLVSPRGHTMLADIRRAKTILARARLVAWIAAAIMPLFIFSDLVLLPWDLAQNVVAARIVAAAALIAIAIATRRTESIGFARAVLVALFMVPLALFLFANGALADLVSLTATTTLVSTYMLFPFVIAAGIAIFPVTVAEALVLFVPVVVVTAAAPVLRGSALDWGQAFSSLWLLLMIGGAAMAAAVSQLHLLLQLLGTTARDRLTGAFTRRVGEELLDLAYASAVREEKPLTVVLIDLDDFKTINDRFGHDAGDRALATAANVLALGMRRGDIVVRWGGDEFLLVLPNTDARGAREVIDRVCGSSFGTRLTGDPQTASLGLSERTADRPASVLAMVKRADDRARQAKRAGKDRCIGCDELPIDDLFAA